MVVLSHALGSSSEMWERVLPLLAARHRVVRSDTRGHGRSPAPPGPVRHRRPGGRPAGAAGRAGDRAGVVRRAVDGRRRLHAAGGDGARAARTGSRCARPRRSSATGTAGSSAPRRCAGRGRRRSPTSPWSAGSRRSSRSGSLTAWRAHPAHLHVDRCRGLRGVLRRDCRVGFHRPAGRDHGPDDGDRRAARSDGLAGALAAAGGGDPRRCACAIIPGRRT